MLLLQRVLWKLLVPTSILAWIGLVVFAYWVHPAISFVTLYVSWSLMAARHRWENRDEDA